MQIRFVMAAVNGMYSIPFLRLLALKSGVGPADSRTVRTAEIPPHLSISAFLDLETYLAIGANDSQTLSSKRTSGCAV